MNLYNVPGLHYVGHVSHPHVNGGQTLPMFEPVAPKGHPGINTMEGWIALANKANGKAFVLAFGREPVCKAELRAWEDSHFDNDFQWEGAEQ